MSKIIADKLNGQNDKRSVQLSCLSEACYVRSRLANDPDLYMYEFNAYDNSVVWSVNNPVLVCLALAQEIPDDIKYTTDNNKFTFSDTNDMHQFISMVWLMVDDQMLNVSITLELLADNEVVVNATTLI